MPGTISCILFLFSSLSLYKIFQITVYFSEMSSQRFIFISSLRCYSAFHDVGPVPEEAEVYEPM